MTSHYLTIYLPGADLARALQRVVNYSLHKQQKPRVWGGGGGGGGRGIFVERKSDFKILGRRCLDFLYPKATGGLLQLSISANKGKKRFANYNTASAWAKTRICSARISGFKIHFLPEVRSDPPPARIQRAHGESSIQNGPVVE